MELQKACGYFQWELAGSYCGLGDCLLKQGKPDLAIRSFGGREPQNVECAKVLAWAYAQTKDFTRAEKLLQDDADWRCAAMYDNAQLAATGFPKTRRLGRTSLAANPGGGQR